MKTNHRPWLVALCLFSVVACAKKTFINLTEPAVVIQLKGGNPIDILQEPLKDGRIQWDEKKMPAIEVEGALRVTYQKTDYFYWQLKCPQQLPCNGEKAYIPISMTKHFSIGNMPFEKELHPGKDFQFYLARKGDENAALALRDWLQKKKQVKPEKYLPDMMLAMLEIDDNNILERQDKLVHFYLYSIFAASDEKSIQAYPWLIRYFEKYKGYLQAAPKNESSPDGEKKASQANDFTNSMADHMKKLYDRYLHEAVEKFPLRGSGYKQLATEFNKLTNAPLARELIIAKIFADKSLELSKGPSGNDDYVCDRLVGQPNIIFGNSKIGVSLTQTYDKDLNLHMQADSAEATDKGLRFFVTFESDVYKYASFPEEKTEPAQTAGEAAPAPVVESSPGINNASPTDTPRHKDTARNSCKMVLNPKPDVPSQYLSVTQHIENEMKEFKKTITDNDFNNGISNASLMRFALKYGKGDFDKKTWLYKYSVPLTKGKVYNTFLAMAKYNASNGTAGDSDYGGELPKSDVRWFQQASQGSYSFGIRIPARACGRGCGETPAVTETCFGNGDSIDVLFDPRVVKDSDPNVRIDFGKQTYECQEILKPRRA